MLKRAGCIHTAPDLVAIEDGSLAVECIVCPHPGKNMSPGFEIENADKP